jgi:hypothetical protein
MTTYVFMEIGCTDCALPSEVLMVTEDIGTVGAAWDAKYDEIAAAYRERRPNDPLGGQHLRVPFGAHQFRVVDNWPKNVISLDSGGEGALVVYAVEPS